MPHSVCEVPIKVRLQGRLSDDDLEQLEEAVARQVGARLRLAHRTLNAESIHPGGGSRVPRQVAAQFAGLGPRAARGLPGAPQPSTSRKRGRHGQSAEHRYAHEHPEGVGEAVSPNHWILWNFDIGGSTLKPGHRQMLDKIAAAWRDIASAVTGSQLLIDGHASRTGAEILNVQLSYDRADEVASYIARGRGSGQRIRITEHGYREPRFPSLTGELMARNRRVEVRIVPPAREPIEQPRVKGEVLWGQPRGLAGTGYSIEGKFTIKKGEIRAGPYIVLYPELLFTFKLEVKTRVPIAWKISPDMTMGIKLKLTESVDIKADLQEGKISAKFGQVPFKPELEFDLGELLKHPTQWFEDPDKFLKPVGLKFSILEFHLPEVDMGNRIPQLIGAKVDISGTLRLDVKIGPSTLLLLRVGAAAASRAGPMGVIVGGTVAATALFTYGAVAITQAALERGERHSGKINLRWGYAWRMAAEAVDWRPSGAVTDNAGWRHALDSVQRLRHEGEIPFSFAYEGWQSAEGALHTLRPPQRDALLKGLKERWGTIERIQDEIFRRAGGYEDDETRPPADPLALLVSNSR
jgi:outer membrane protein OmpA-like peptidoglycan-associated protein